MIEPQQDFSHTVSVDHSRAQKESRTGIYKPGGPTTFFGADAVGPFRGEMSSTKKAMLARENLTEENWMHACALSILEANEDLRRGRAERIIPGAGLEEVQVQVANTHGTVIEYAASKGGGIMNPNPSGEDHAEGQVDVKVLEEGIKTADKPAAVYEVHTGVLHCTHKTSPSLERPGDTDYA